MGGTGQVGYGPLWRIDGPPPVEERFGLLQAATAPAAGVRIVVDTDLGPLAPDVVEEAGAALLDRAGQERWLNGVEVFPYPQDVGDVYDPCAAGSIQQAMGFGATQNQTTHPQFGAMTVWLAETCTTSHVWDQEEYRARAALVLAAVEGPSVAREFMSGRRLPSNPHLSDGNGVFPVGDTALAAGRGLALLEDIIAQSGRLGLIHCSPGLATTIREKFAVADNTGVLRTINGNVIIADYGYAGAVGQGNAAVGVRGYRGLVTPASSSQWPSGHAAPTQDQEWMFCTGPIDIRRSELFVTPDNLFEALDRGSAATNNLPNAITYRAERYYLVDWDQLVQGAVLVDRTL